MAEVALIERLEKAVIKLESLLSESHRTSGAINGVNGELAPYVEAFDRLMNESVAEFIKNSRILDGDIKTHAEMVHAAFQAQRAFLWLTSRYQEPQQNEVAILLKPISEKIQQIQTFRERNRGSNMFNHLSAVSESIPALGWITISAKPGPYVKEMNDAATFYTNRVLKDYKHSDLRHIDWVKSFLNIWTELQAYIKEYHTTGLIWSKTGPVASAASSFPAVGNKQGLPPPPPPLPPPPPPPGPPPATDTENAKDDATASRSALFAQLNQGETITKGLRHVSDDQKTHKNPSLRAQGVPMQSPTKTYASEAPKVLPQKSYSPVLELEGKKWRVSCQEILVFSPMKAENFISFRQDKPTESISSGGRDSPVNTSTQSSWLLWVAKTLEYQENKNDLLISDTELKQVAYIFKCTKSTIQIKGKVNSITIDNCKKFGLVFDNVVGIVEVINSKDIQIQVLGKVPTISVNKTEGCHIYLSEESLDCEIVSAKSSEMNILVPVNGDYKEFPVPEQFKTSWDGSKLVTDPTEIMA